MSLIFSLSSKEGILEGIAQVVSKYGKGGRPNKSSTLVLSSYFLVLS